MAKEIITGKDLEIDKQRKRIFVTIANCSLPIGYPKMPIKQFVAKMEELSEKYPDYKIEKIETSPNSLHLHDNINISIVKF